METAKLLSYFSLIKRYCSNHCSKCYKCAFYEPYEYGGGGCIFTTNALGDHPSWWKLDKLEYKFSRMFNELKEASEQTVKRGKWEDSSNGWTCSCCGRDSTYDTRFCSNCGADMRGE